MLRNICDTNGKIVYHGFLDAEPHVRLAVSPQRTAFTRSFKPNAVLQTIIDHGGGRFWADRDTLHYLTQSGLIVTRYCDREGKIIDDFPVNPNGSMLSIESITNLCGNLKLGMGHDERKLNALKQHPMNSVFASMREYIEDGCPDLSGHAAPQRIPPEWKSFPHLSQPLAPERTLDIYVKMLTDDNERTTAQLFLDGKVPLDRRRLLRVELTPEAYGAEAAQRVVLEIAGMDFLDGIMLKKDLPTVTALDLPILTYAVVGKDNGRLIRQFVLQEQIVPGYPVTHTEVPLPNIGGYEVMEKLRHHPWLSQAVTNVHAGRTWFFPDENAKRKTLERLLR